MPEELQNNNDIFANNIPDIGEEEIESLKQIQENNQTVSTLGYPKDNSQPKSELSFVAQKAFISFGTMLVCALVIYLIVSLIKKLNEDKEEKISDIIGSTKKVNNTRPRKPKADKITSLSVPKSVNQCIRAFLENTKRN